MSLTDGGTCSGAESFPFRWDRPWALSFCFDAFSSREPVSTSLEDALDCRSGSVGSDLRQQDQKLAAISVRRRCTLSRAARIGSAGPVVGPIGTKRTSLMPMK